MLKDVAPQCTTLSCLNSEGKNASRCSVLVPIQTLMSCWVFILNVNQVDNLDSSFDEVVA